MRLVLLGPPGAGKGTQAGVLSHRLGIPHISTGDMLREAARFGNPIGMKAKSYMETGDLVPDEVVTEIVKQRLERVDASEGFILDGYPRTEAQAGDLETALKEKGKSMDLVLYFKTSPDVSIQRLSGRRICPNCNINYHVTNRPPKKEGICDDCGIRLYQRDDDKASTVSKRLEVYEAKTKDLVDYYKKTELLREIPGDYEVEPLYKFLVDLFKRESLS